MSKGTAIVAFGHVDVTLSLFKELCANKQDIDLILIFSQQRKCESILDFRNVPVNDGLLSRTLSKKILGEKLLAYLGELSVRIFIYNNQKFLSWKNALLSLQLAKKLRKYKTIHFSGEHGALLHLITLLPFKRKVFTIHDFYPHTGERNKFANRFMHNYMMKSKHSVIIQNKSDYNILRLRFPCKHKKLFYIPFGILDIYTCFNDDSSTENSDLLFFGRISTYKGIIYLAKSLKILAKQGVKVKCIIAGNGEFTAEEKQLLSDKNLQVKIINTYITNELLAKLLHGTRFVVCPYTDATQSAVVMTSYAFNKPVIATTVGNFEEIVCNNKTGKLVSPSNSEELALALEDVLTNGIQHEKVSFNQIPELNHYLWSSIANKTMKVYDPYQS